MMDKKSKIALFLIVFVVLLMMVAEVTKPKAINWRDSYSASDKIPLGCYVLFNELRTSQLDQFQVSKSSAFEYLRNNDLPENSTFLFINNYVNLGDDDSKTLEAFVSKGNTVFISTLYLSGDLADTLNIAISQDYNNLFKKPSTQSFTSPHLKTSKKVFSDVIENGFLKSFDTLNTTVLGRMSQKGDSVSHANFIKIRFGKGEFYVHSNPFAFSNYHLLGGKEDYAATVLSFLPNSLYIWDNYYKSGRKIITSPLRFVLTNPALRWAFYLILITLLVFVLFKGKRTQRIIPVIDPLKNDTVHFTQTISQLYYQNGDYTNIINKKIKFFLEVIRTRYFLNTNDLNEQFIKKLSLKSNKTIEDIKRLIDGIVYLKTKDRHTEKELKSLNNQIEKFLKSDQ